MALGDGGKTICGADVLLRGPACLVISVGINENTEFEEALLRAHPNCQVVGYDGTLNAVKRMRAHERVPALQLHEQNFDTSVAAKYRGRTVQLLKIDCDGCEFTTLPTWVEAVCTEQIVVEVHRTLYVRPYARMMKIHKLMMNMDKLYGIFYLEPNSQFPWLNTEYSMIRREPCPR